jgi:Tfp pilus assembly PilM family ATPase
MNLYYDFSVAGVLKNGTIEVQIIATPRAIVDSYIGMFDALGLEIAVVESNITAMTRIVVNSEAHDVNIR